MSMIDTSATFLSNMYLQTFLWTLCVVFAIYFAISVKKMSFGEDVGSIAWMWIAFGLFMFGIRIAFKIVLPSYGSSYSLQIIRYGIGMIGIIAIYIGFLKYQSALRRLFGVTE